MSSSSDPSKALADSQQGESREVYAPLQAKSQQVGPGLHIVATPIGNLRDITLRALDTLASVDEILAEDTRMARRLLDAYGISAKVTAYHDHNGAARRPELVARLKDGATLALISDAGTPLVSDPGWKLVRDVIDAGAKVIPIPGASAMLAGLVASGLPSDQFLFAGFLPAKSGARRATATKLKTVPATLIFYETGPRLTSSLQDLTLSLGADRDAVIARELTKFYEEIRRGTLGELAEHYAEAGPPKGEIVLLVGPPGEVEITEDMIDNALADLLGDMPVKAAAAQVAEQLGISRRQAYQRAIELKKQRND